MDKPYTLLFVDDEQDILDSLYRSFRKDHNIIRCNSGEQAIDTLNHTPIDLIICDQRMPEVTGAEVLTHACQVQPEAIRILLTGYSDLNSLVECVNQAQIYKYISKPWEPEALRLTVTRALESLHLNRQLKSTQQELEDAYLHAVTMLAVACEGKDETTGNHVRRVQYFTESLAKELNFSNEQAIHMGVMSILHDVGKIYIPDAILKKEGKLTEEEWVVMKRHAEYGGKILGDHPYFTIAKEIAVAHHENFDGSGYPKGLNGNEIPMSARIAKVADTFDALTTTRPYKQAWSIEQALEWMHEKSASMFDPVVINALTNLADQGELQKIMLELP